MPAKQVVARVRRVFIVVCAASAMVGFLSASASGEMIGNQLWNLRENGQDFFHDNDSWVRPWRTSVDDGWGDFQGPHTLDFPWTPMGTTGNPLDGSLSLNRGVDTQFHVWTYLYVSASKTIALTGDGDCVPRWFLNTQFDSPHEFVVGDPTDISLLAGWNRLDITGYNQNAGFLFTTDALAPQVDIMASSPVPEPSTLALLVCGVMGFLFTGGKTLAKKFFLLPTVALVALAGTAAHAATVSGITLTDLGPGVTPNALNNNGQVVGQDASGQAFLWQAGSFQSLGNLGGIGNAANDINDSRVAVGWAYRTDGKRAAFKWDQANGMVNLQPTTNYDYGALAYHA